MNQVSPGKRRSRPTALLAGLAIVLALAGTALAASLLAGTYKGSGNDDRLGSVRFKINNQEIVSGFVAKSLLVDCTTQNGPFSYRLPLDLQESDKLDNDGVFSWSEPTSNNNGTIKVRGELTSDDLIPRFRGRVRLVNGDVITDEGDIGDCASGVAPFRVKQR